MQMSTEPSLPTQGAEGPQLLFTVIAERYERPSLGINSNLIFSLWMYIFANLMATVVTIVKGGPHSVSLNSTFQATEQEPSCSGVLRSSTGSGAAGVDDGT